MKFTVEMLNPHKYQCTDTQKANMQSVCNSLNILFAEYKKPIVVTSGLRSAEYNATLKNASPKSWHLVGLAVDLRDTDEALEKWCEDNPALMEKADFWREPRRMTTGWLHLQKHINPQKTRLPF